MAILKRLNRPRCRCGKNVTEGSVFCIHCRAEVKRKNLKVLSVDKFYLKKKKPTARIELATY